MEAITGNAKKKLEYIVERHAQLAKEIKGLKFEQKELEDSAPEQCGVSAKTVKQLSKESNWSDVEREKQRQREEELDAARAALGMLADTPLGEAEMRRAEENLQQSKTPAKGKKKGGKKERADEFAE